MTQIGEMVGISIFGAADADHSEDRCPWHKKAATDAGTLAAADLEEDNKELEDNDGGVLGGNIGQFAYLNAVVVQVPHQSTTSIHVPQGKKSKELALYEPSAPQTIGVTYSAHHCIPGNEALKGHDIVKWLGAENKIGAAQDESKPSSVIKADQFSGYDVNNKENGIWLPGPYKLSTKGKWPAEDLMDKCVKKGTISSDARQKNLSFKEAYAFAAIDATAAAITGKPDADQTYIGPQFHYRHVQYSKQVIKSLDKANVAIGNQAAKCPLKPKDDADGKFEVPRGLPGRLNMISRRFGAYLRGLPWSKSVYTDDLSAKYITQHVPGAEE